MKLSIITVCYNNLPGLKKTYASIKPFIDNYPIIWIVIDGASTDGTIEFIGNVSAELDENKFIYRTEEDNGLYHAMNKGVFITPEDSYIIFINAGDLLCSEIFKSSAYDDAFLQNYNMFMGVSKRFLGNRVYIKRPKRNLERIKYGMICEHQAIIFSASVAKRLLYNTSYRISSDYDFVIRAIKMTGVDSVHISDKTFCSFEVGGVSKIKRYEAIIEDMLIRYRNYEQSILKVVGVGVVHIFWEFVKRKLNYIR